MNTYLFRVVETVTKFVTVEADSYEKAEELAYMEDMSKNFDDYSLEAELIRVHD